jgi:hypothetical protein
VATTEAAANKRRADAAVNDANDAKRRANDVMRRADAAVNDANDAKRRADATAVNAIADLRGDLKDEARYRRIFAGELHELQRFLLVLPSDAFQVVRYDSGRAWPQPGLRPGELQSIRPRVLPAAGTPGHGACAEIFRATTALGSAVDKCTTVALKVYDPSHRATYANREVRAYTTLHLKNPRAANVVQVFGVTMLAYQDAGPNGDRFPPVLYAQALVMEWLGSSDSFRHVSPEAFASTYKPNAATLYRMLGDMARGVADLHAADIVHYDLKDGAFVVRVRIPGQGATHRGSDYVRTILFDLTHAIVLSESTPPLVNQPAVAAREPYALPTPRGGAPPADGRPVDTRLDVSALGFIALRVLHLYELSHVRLSQWARYNLEAARGWIQEDAHTAQPTITAANFASRMYAVAKDAWDSKETILARNP